MTATIKAEAVRWFALNSKTKGNAVYASKFYIPEKSWTRQSAWWFEIPRQAIETPKSVEFHLLCQSIQDAKEFYHLKVPAEILKTELPNLCVRKTNKVSLFLSAERNEMFVEKRGRGKVNFNRFLVHN
jgi:hypothetical protein